MSDIRIDAKTDADREMADPPDAPGDIPHPDHHVDVPAAPSTHPPEPPLVPSAEGFAVFWNMYGPTTLLILVGLVIAAFVLWGVGGG
ncbi:hypothetical protein [Terrihabitans sp. B22-R8]|uniref:hypothetical protein n=1 Tax=Terrihabitans sp. B22-R8 TaxID=3425128 RepID=UPI00403C4152